VERKLASRQALSKIEAAVESQFANGRLYAVIASRPGQSGRADGYILEGEELSFYLRKMVARK
jgi:small subunit ribosomal protein S8e